MARNSEVKIACSQCERVRYYHPNIIARLKKPYLCKYCTAPINGAKGSSAVKVLRAEELKRHEG